MSGGLNIIDESIQRDIEVIMSDMAIKIEAVPVYFSLIIFQVQNFI